MDGYLFKLADVTKAVALDEVLVAEVIKLPKGLPIKALI